MIADEPIKNLGGRPEAEIDLDVVHNSASIGCTIAEIAAVLGVSKSTLCLHMQKYPEIQETIDSGRESGRGTLRRAQWNGATVDRNPTMLIWLGKMMLGQRDVTNVQQLDANGQPTNPTVNEYRWADPSEKK